MGLLNVWWKRIQSQFWPGFIYTSSECYSQWGKAVLREKKIDGEMENDISLVPFRIVLFHYAGACQHCPWWAQVDFAGWRHRSNVDRVTKHCHGWQQGMKEKKEIIPNHLRNQSPCTFGNHNSTQGLIKVKNYYWYLHFF